MQINDHGTALCAFTDAAPPALRNTAPGPFFPKETLLFPDHRVTLVLFATHVILPDSTFLISPTGQQSFFVKGQNSGADYPHPHWTPTFTLYVTVGK